jgi:sugar (pentulose or hexulose) kinase
MNRAKYFLGWHEFLILHLGGVAVTDGSLAGKPIEVTHFPELATLGAALLAGLAAGDYSTLEEGAEVWIPPHRCSELDPQRVALHRENLEAYRE